jgi:hypothetical protein
MQVPKGLSPPKVLEEDTWIAGALFPAGTMVWRRKGVIHNKFGPAIITPDGYKYFFYKGYSITPEKLFEKLTPKQRKKAAFNIDLWR